MAKTTLDKLGWKPGMDGAVAGLPDDLVDVFRDVTARADGAAWRLWFVRDRAALAAAAPAVADAMATAGHLWIAYPKKTGAIVSDLTRDHGWEPIAALDLLGVTQIAIDDTWSALRFKPRAAIKTLTRKF